MNPHPASRSAARIARDTAAGVGWLILGLHALFALAFFATLFTLAPPARAESTVACTGRNIVENLDAATLAKIRAEAAKIPNGDANLWKIEKAGVAPSWLLGTIHMTDPRVVKLPPAAQAAFDASKTVVIETTDILNPKAMATALFSRPELTMFSGSDSLKSLIPRGELPAVEEGLEQRGIPLDSVMKMKPWLLSAVVAMPACELARKDDGAPVLDQKLAEDAQAAGKSVAGLETAISQLEAMASLPMDFHVRGLVETLKLGPRLDDMIETMIDIYLDGHTGLYWPLFRAVMPEQTEVAGYSAFEEVMVTARNGVMAANAAPFIDKGGAFIAVGALHLPGADGVVERLRRAGYTVTAAPR